MQTIQLRNRRQITLPPSIVGAAQLQLSDELSVRFKDGVSELRPLGRMAAPAVDISQYLGACAGVWGRTAEDIDRAIAEDRGSFERDVCAAP